MYCFFSFLFQHHSGDLRLQRLASIEVDFKASMLTKGGKQHYSSELLLLLPWLASFEVDFKASMDARPSFHSTFQHKITVALSGVTPTQQQGAVLGQVYGLSDCHNIITLQPPSNLHNSHHLFLKAFFPCCFPVF